MAISGKGLFFLGLKHSGKTTFASMYSERHGIMFADADYLVLKIIKPCTIRDFYREKGQKAFQEMELDAVDDFLLMIDRPFALSLGGGASDNIKLLERIQKEGKLIYLYRKEEDMLPVILKDGIPPFLDSSNPEKSFHELYLRRDRIYRKWADLVVDLGPYGDMEETYTELTSKLKEAGV